MFRILFCAPLSALPFHCLTSQSFASPSLRLSEPVRFVVRASCHFFAFSMLSAAERFYAVSILRPSTPCLGVSAGIVSAPIYSVSAPVPAIPYLTLLLTSLLFIFSTKLLCALPFLSLCMSDQIHIRSTHFRIFSHLCQSTLLLLSSSLRESRPLPASLLQCSAHRLRSISHQSHFIHVSAVLLHCLAIQFFSLPCHCVSLRYFILLPSSLFLCAVAHQISAFLIRFVAFLRSSFAALFTIQGVLMPCLLSAF